MMPFAGFEDLLEVRNDKLRDLMQALCASPPTPEIDDLFEKTPEDQAEEEEGAVEDYYVGETEEDDEEYCFNKAEKNRKKFEIITKLSDLIAKVTRSIGVQPQEEDENVMTDQEKEMYRILVITAELVRICVVSKPYGPIQEYRDLELPAELEKILVEYYNTNLDASDPRQFLTNNVLRSGRPEPLVKDLTESELQQLSAGSLFETLILQATTDSKFLIKPGNKDPERAIHHGYESMRGYQFGESSTIPLHTFLHPARPTRKTPFFEEYNESNIRDLITGRLGRRDLPWLNSVLEEIQESQGEERMPEKTKSNDFHSLLDRKMILIMSFLCPNPMMSRFSFTDPSDKEESTSYANAIRHSIWERSGNGYLNNSKKLFQKALKLQEAKREFNRFMNTPLFDETEELDRIDDCYGPESKSQECMRLLKITSLDVDDTIDLEAETQMEIVSAFGSYPEEIELYGESIFNWIIKLEATVNGVSKYNEWVAFNQVIHVNGTISKKASKEDQIPKSAIHTSFD